MKKEHLILIAILCLSLAIRFYRLPHMVGFDFDQEYAVTFAQSVLGGSLTQLIGQGLSVQGLFMGPFYFYYLVPFFAATSLHPLGGYIGSILLGLIIILTYYFVLSQLFGKTTGLIAAFLRAILYYKIIADLTMAPSYSSELAILVTLFCFSKYWHGKYIYLLPMGFVFGMYTSFHPILFPFYGVFLAIFLIRRKIPPLKYLIGSIILFLIPLFPLILFEYYRNFLEIKLLFALDSTSSAEPKTLSSFVQYGSFLFHYLATLFGPQVTNLLSTIIATSAIAGIGYALIKKLGFWIESFHRIFFLLTIGVFLIYYILLPTKVSDYYFLGAEVALFIYAVATLSLLTNSKRYISVVALTIAAITLLNFSYLSHFWRNPPSNNLYDKEAVIKEIARRQKDNNMNIAYDIEYGQQYGFGHLARLYNLSPKGGENVPTYTIVLPKSKATEKLSFSSGNIGLIVEE